MTRAAHPDRSLRCGPAAPRTTRRAVLAALLAAAGMAVLPARAGVTGGSPADRPAPPGGGEPGSAGGNLPPWFPHQNPELVQRVVGASHGDLETVRELVGRWPELAKAQWDWGFGDWESALGAASHTGRREIAELLLAHGARPTLFSAAMLGQLEVVRAFIEASPGIQAIPGPHGIPLLAHARTGGKAAAPVVAYLEEVGGAAGAEAVEPDPGRRERLVGAYRAETEAGERFEVTVGRFGLMLAPEGGPARRLVPRAGDAFHPAGAPSVRVAFDLPEGDGPAHALTLGVTGLSVSARRVP